jgi:threonine synthase
LRKLRAAKQIPEEASVVAILTGHALKDTNFIIRAHEREEAHAH